MHDARGQFLSEAVVSGSSCSGVLLFGLLAPFTSRGQFRFLQGRRGAIKDVNRNNAVFQQRTGALEETHQVRHVASVGRTKRHPVALGERSRMVVRN